jgi:predicted methyltransferase
MARLLSLLTSLAIASACATPSAPPPSPKTSADDPINVVAQADRSREDRALDPGRNPGELLAFLGLKPGMKVADLAAGAGYTTELLARAVGPSGVVYSQNSRFVVEKFAEKPWSERLAKPVNRGVIRVVREMDEPLPPDVKDLDAVVMVLFYHDTVWQGVDRDRMNRAIFDALEPGGVYLVVDHSGRKDTGTTEVQTLHRIEEVIVREEIAKAGFVLAGEGSFLRNANDPRDWNASPSSAGERRGTSDRFVLKYRKP